MNIIVIPARLESSRLHNKLVLLKDGKPIIVHTIEAALKSKQADMVILASGDDEILDISKKIESDRFTTFKSRLQHSCGTSRVLEAIRDCSKITGKCVNCVVNWQGDEPDLKPENIDKLIVKINKLSSMDKSQYYVATLACKATSSEMDDPSKVKVVINQEKEAMYFSRSHIPYNGIGLRHIGVYAFSARTISKLSITSSVSYSINSSENLEQLSWLETGFSTHVITIGRCPCGIDTAEDYNSYLKRK